MAMRKVGMGRPAKNGYFNSCGWLFLLHRSHART